MSTYQFDFTVITDGDTEGDAMEEAMQLLADYRFAKEAATVTVLDHVPVDTPIQKVAALSADLREQGDGRTGDDLSIPYITVEPLLDALDALLSEREGLS